MTTPSTISYRRGDIVLVSFPFTDLTFAKRRPALAVTSQLSPFPHSIPVLPGDCEDGALPKCYEKLEGAGLEAESGENYEGGRSGCPLRGVFVGLLCYVGLSP
jgi:hypothetical protein